jgi:hypothetical protein
VPGPAANLIVVAATTIPAPLASRTASGPPAALAARWAGLGGRLGLGFALGGFLLIAVAWNGAAGLDYVQGQLPYLISGGVGGLSLVVLGSALLIVENARRDRALLERRLEELVATMGRSVSAPAGHAGQVVAGAMSFHHPDCRLVEERGAELVSRARAEEEGLSACRVCTP